MLLRSLFLLFLSFIFLDVYQGGLVDDLITGLKFYGLRLSCFFDSFHP